MKKVKDLLSEEIKRFQQISEYDFYVPENYHEDDLIIDEDDEEMGGDMGEPEGDSEMGLDGDASAEPEMDAEPEGDVEMGIDPEASAEPEMGGDMSGEEEVEIDITQLVQGTEDAKMMAQQSNQKIDTLTAQLNDITNKLTNMDSISNKIEGLSAEMEKRLPTDQEKLEMRSLDSYPYSQKLTDYWFDKEGAYDVIGNKEEQKPKEYVLTKDDVDSGYNDGSIKNTFNSDDDNEFEEEDIY